MTRAHRPLHRPVLPTAPAAPVAEETPAPVSSDVPAEEDYEQKVETEITAANAADELAKMRKAVNGQ